MRRALRHAALLLSGWLTAGFAPSPSSSRRTVRLSSVVPQIDSRELLLALERLDNAFLTHLYEADADDFVTEPSTVTEEHAALARGFKLSTDGSWRMDVHEGPKLYTRAAVASGDAFSLESDDFSSFRLLLSMLGPQPVRLADGPLLRAVARLDGLL